MATIPALSIEQSPELMVAVQAIIDHYSSLAKQTLTQNFALQLLFDIYFMQTLLVSRDSKDQFSTGISTIVSSLETNIDPFDLSVSPHTSRPG